MDGASFAKVIVFLGKNRSVCYLKALGCWGNTEIVLADPNRDRFEERLAGLAEKSDPRKRVEKVVTDDGLIVDVVKPVRKPSVPYRSLLIAILLFICLKGAIFAQLGEEEYLARVDGLKNGSSLEVTAAFLLDADPITTMMGQAFSKLIN